ncbi:MAG: CPBP family intramembrane metalloprotease [Actinobacteria bacterium]|nr:CPBP family intramembrane metalloprotease [Actinomycetota bacterium]
MSAGKGFAAAAGLLGAVNLGGVLLPGWSYLPVNLAALAALVAIARRSGAGAGDLGLEASRLRPGLRAGLAAAAVVAAAVAALAAVPALRDLFRDDRAAGVGMGGLLYQVALRIPVGTALFEEAAFRGVLVGLGRKAWGRRAGTWLPALGFGLWHIAPAVDAAHANETAGGLPVAVVVALAVAATAAAGAVLTALRDRFDGLAVPVLVHAAANASAFTAAWLIV